MSISIAVSKKVYSRRAVEVAAHVFERRAEVLLGEGRGRMDIELRARRRGVSAADLEVLAADFLNELLNQEYRFLVSKFNKPVSDLVLTQALYSASGAGNPPPKADESDPAFKADVERMLAEAREEIARTMPKRIPSRGVPLPPAKEEPVG